VPAKNNTPQIPDKDSMALLGKRQKNYLVPTKDGALQVPGKGSTALFEGQKNYMVPTKGLLAPYPRRRQHGSA
jgi:hypothetical protein